MAFCHDRTLATHDLAALALLSTHCPTMHLLVHLAPLSVERVQRFPELQVLYPTLHHRPWQALRRRHCLRRMRWRCLCVRVQRRGLLLQPRQRLLICLLPAPAILAPPYLLMLLQGVLAQLQRRRRRRRRRSIKPERLVQCPLLIIGVSAVLRRRLRLRQWLRVRVPRLRRRTRAGK